MTDEYRGDELMAEIEKQLRSNVEAACILVQGAARANVRTGGQSGLHRRSGQLINSITFEVEQEGQDMLGRVGTNLKYARIHEYGGVIQPTSAQALAVPVHPSAEGHKPKDFPDLVLIKRPGRPPLLVRKVATKAKGLHERMDVMFVLLKSVHIPARPYLRPALNENQDKIRALLARGIGK
jgi:phage gpG-like protein